MRGAVFVREKVAGMDPEMGLEEVSVGNVKHSSTNGCL